MDRSGDDFGSRDEDWDVYKAISREQDSDSEIENEKILEYDDILRHHDPLFNDTDEPQLKMGMAEYHQVSFKLQSLFTKQEAIIFKSRRVRTICYDRFGDSHSRFR